MDRRATLFVLIALLFTLCSGCDEKIINHNKVFYGKTDQWMAELRITGKGRLYRDNGTLKYDSYADRQFTLTYLGNIKGLANVKKLSYSYKNDAGIGGGGEEEYDIPPTDKIFTLHSGGNGSVESNDDVLHVTVELDGVQTSFDMTCAAAP